MSNDRKRRLATAAAFLTAATAASRVLGLIREMVMVSFLGLGAGMGAFTVAFKVPSLVRTLLADTALSAAFIPVFSELLEKGHRRRAWQMAAAVTLISFVVLGVISLLGIVFAPQVIRLAAPGYRDQETIALAVHLTRIMFPTVVVFGMGGILMGILNTYDHFALPALAPILWNLIIIAGVVLFSGHFGFGALAWAVLIGAVIEVAIQIPAVLQRREARLSRPALRDPAVRQVGVLLGPVVLSLGIINFNALIDTIVASYISDPAPAYIDKAFRLFQLPQGMFAVAIGTVLFPTLSRLAATRRFAEFREALGLGLRQIFFVTLPFTAFFLLLAGPTTRLIYGNGDVVKAEEVAQVAWALTFFSIGMAFVSGNTLLTRAFYGIQKSWLPLTVGAVNLVLNLGLDLLLYRPLGVGGITLSTSLVSLFNFLALFVLLRRDLGRLGGREFLQSTLRSLLATLPLAAGSLLSWYVLDRWLGRSVPAQLVSLGTAYLVGAALYVAAARLLRIPELDDLLDVVRRRPRVEVPTPPAFD